MERFNDKNLTKREIEILELVASGFSNQIIAAKINVSVHTVKSHLESIYRKFEVHNKIQALVYAITNSVIKL